MGAPLEAKSLPAPAGGSKNGLAKGDLANSDLASGVLANSELPKMARGGPRPASGKVASADFPSPAPARERQAAPDTLVPAAKPASIWTSKRLLARLLFTAVFLALPFGMRAVGGAYWVRVLDFTLLYAMMALGLNIIVGYAGLLDMGFIAFYAVGAYLAALLSSPHLTSQFPFLLVAFPGGLHVPTAFLALGAMAGAAGAGTLLGWPTLRLRGDYLAIVTLGFGEIIRVFLRNLDRPINITNGPKGIMQVDPAAILGLDFSKTLRIGDIQLRSIFLYYYLLAALVLLAVLVFWQYRSRYFSAILSCLRIRNQR